jgi:hypothetical protein
MAKKLKVYEKPAYKVGVNEIDRKTLEHLQRGASVLIGTLPTYGTSVSVTNPGDVMQAWGLYSKKKGALKAIRFTREECRQYRDDFHIHRVTVIRGDRVR